MTASWCCGLGLRKIHARGALGLGMAAGALGAGKGALELRPGTARALRRRPRKCTRTAARGMPFQPAIPSAGQQDGPGRGPHPGCFCPGLQTPREG